MRIGVSRALAKGDDRSDWATEARSHQSRPFDDLQTATNDERGGPSSKVEAMVDTSPPASSRGSERSMVVVIAIGPSAARN